LLQRLGMAAMFLRIIGFVLGMSFALFPAQAQEKVAQTVSDITAILDNEKPDPVAIARLRAEANTAPKNGLPRSDLAEFHFSRCSSRATLGDFKNAHADCEKAVELAREASSHVDYGRMLQGLALQYGYIGETKKSLDAWLRLAREMDVKGSRGFLFNANRNISQLYIALGDVKQGEAYVRRNTALLEEAKGWDTYEGFRRASWNGDVERGYGVLYEARGQYREAELAYRRAEEWWVKRQGMSLPDTLRNMPPDQTAHALDLVRALIGRMKAHQGRMAEGESDVRRTLLGRLKVTGKYNLQTSKFFGHLANLMVEQGRLTEAEKLIRAQLDAHQSLGADAGSGIRATALAELASVLNLQGRWEEAAKTYAELDQATASWPAARKEGIGLNTNLINTLYATNNVQAGLTAAERLLERQKGRFGDQHVETALARGVLAIGLAKADREQDAEREFKLAVPVLAGTSHESDVDDAIGSAARDQRMAMVMESYMGLLLRKGTQEAASEGFKFADMVRSRAVERALAASGARAVARNPALAEQARRLQDLEKQYAAQLALFNGALSIPSSERDERALNALRADIDRLRSARDAAKKDLAGRFREYANLIEPQPATVDDIRKTLHPQESFLSYYFGREASFVWAVAKEGPIGFALLPMRLGDIESRVAELRAPLVAEDVPPFDVGRAHALYAELLQPVESIWRPSKSLIVATNGALGLLPLGLLPTAATQVVQSSDSPAYAGYRSVPWLARTHAVTMVPSAASLRTLRQLPPASAKREPFIGFGDPYFTKQQAVDAEKVGAAGSEARIVASRGTVPKRRATAKASLDVFADLERLPETADELKAVAGALSVDPAKVLYLGRNATEQNVKTLDLAKYRFIEFATHGLLPAKEYGLLQPAIALAGPEVTGVKDDGLLTMEEVLALKLDADWVVLSACNSASGAADGAEALSGLGRAFFYAGTRALLVTNWAVDSASARDLVTGIFRALAADPKLPRSEALRLAMLDLIDGPGFVTDDGKTKYTYAHPTFWAPFTIVGDGGGTE
jgi:CHAT domain-containing protein